MPEDTAEVTRLKGRIIELEKAMQGMSRLYAARESALYSRIKDLNGTIAHLQSLIEETNDPQD
jgi:hypothetical protein